MLTLVFIDFLGKTFCSYVMTGVVRHNVKQSYNKNAIKYYRKVHKMGLKCRKRFITRKWCEIGQKIVLITNSKPWVGFPNPPLFWLSWQRGWAKRYSAMSKASPNFSIEEYRQFSKFSWI